MVLCSTPLSAAALRGFNVIVPVDGMSGDGQIAYDEQAVAYILTHAPAVSAKITLTSIDMIKFLDPGIRLLALLDRKLTRAANICRPRCVIELVIRSCGVELHPPTLRENKIVNAVMHLTWRYLPVAVLSIALAAPWASPTAAQNAGSTVALSPELAAAMAQYRRALEEYNKAWQSFTAASSAYWDLISEKRELRNAKRARGEPVSISDYVLDAAAGLYRPAKAAKSAQARSPAGSNYVPVVADFVAAARQEFKFVPRFPQSEIEFKRGYAKVALAAGLTREQIVRIYGFEATGNGSYDIEAGLEYNKHGRAITTALGYNQLLAMNSVEILAEKGDEFIKQFESKSAITSGAEHQPLDGKIGVLRRMVAFARSVPDAWGRARDFGKYDERAWGARP